MHDSPNHSQPRALVTTSWDDGHPADRRLADLLEEHGIPGTFYIPQSNPLDGLPVMAEAEVRGLAQRGFEIGAHTLNHTVLPTLDNAAAAREIRDSRAWVSDVTGRDCTVFSPPNGKHHPRHVGMIRDAGFEGYRTVELWSLDRPRIKTGGLLEMPTTLLALPQPVIGTAKNLIKRRAWRGMTRYLQHGRAGGWADHAAAMLDRAIARGGVFHLWGHAWELEEQDQWAVLETLLRRLADDAASGRIRLTTNGGLCRRTAPADVPTAQTPASAAR